MPSSDTAGLFAPAPAPGSPTMAGGAEAKPRRVQLYPWDHAATQLFEPLGRSVVTDAGTDAVWKAAATGTKAAKFNTLLAADQTDDPWRVGAGLSATAQVLVGAIEELKAPMPAQLMGKSEAYKKAVEEGDSLMPHLQILDFGKGSQKENPESGSFQSLKKKMRFTPSQAPKRTPTKQELQVASEALHKWLSLPTSALRGVLAVLAGKGTFYSAHVFEKVARGMVECKPATKEDFLAALVVRAGTNKDPTGGSSSSSSKDTEGLFE
jgi:hypothetical protein